MPKPKKEKSYLVTVVAVRKRDIEVRATSVPDAISKVQAYRDSVAEFLYEMTEGGTKVYDSVRVEHAYEEDEKGTIRID